MDEPDPGPPLHGSTQERAASVKRLLDCRKRGVPTAAAIADVARVYGVSARSVQRWMTNAEQNEGSYTPQGRDRFTLTDEMRDALAGWGGNIKSTYHEFFGDELRGQEVSLATFHRAVVREMSPGWLAGLRGGEKARQRYDVHMRRERGLRNEAWEADHVQLDVELNIEGRRRKPYLTWFVDCATLVVLGAVLTPHAPSREAVLLALKCSLRPDSPFPFAGTPDLIRFDQGSEFNCHAVTRLLDAFAIDPIFLRKGNAKGKGTIEMLNKAVQSMFCARVPGYNPPNRGRPHWQDEELLTFQDFHTHLLGFIERWNTKHTVPALAHRTPAQAWNDDLTPLFHVDPSALHRHTHDTHPTLLTIRDDGVHWGKTGRTYIAPWMHGQSGTKVRLRYLPHHFDRVELYDPKTDESLGTAELNGRANPELAKAVDQEVQRQQSRLQSALKKSQGGSRRRFGAASTPGPPKDLTVMTTQEAITRLGHDLPGPEPEPDPIPLPEPSQQWTRARTTPQTGHHPAE